MSSNNWDKDEKETKLKIRETYGLWGNIGTQWSSTENQVSFIVENKENIQVENGLQPL